jgi:hypothetical protein
VNAYQPATVELNNYVAGMIELELVIHHDKPYRYHFVNRLRSLTNESVMHGETVDLLGRCGVSSEKSPFYADLPRIHRSSTERPGSKQSQSNMSASPASAVFAKPELS